MASVHVLSLIIVGCTSIFCHRLAMEPQGSQFQCGGKMLEKMVRIEYAIELMNDDVEGNLMTMRKEFDAMRGEFEVMKQHMNEAEEDNRKTMKEEFDALRGEFDFMKQHMNEAEEDNRKTMKKEFNAVKGEFEVMKQHMNEAEENNRKAIKEGFDAVRGEFEVMKLTMKEALEYLEYLKQKKDGRHAFQVLRSKNIISNGYGFLVLEVRVPANGTSRSSNWCFDYQYLCEDFHRRPTGCGEPYRALSKYVECGRIYNSDMDIGDTLGCNPSSAIARLAVKAFPNLISQTQLWKYSFGFHVCRSQDCSVNLIHSGSALYDTAAFKEGHLTFYTVCR